MDRPLLSNQQHSNQRGRSGAMSGHRLSSLSTSVAILALSLIMMSLAGCGFDPKEIDDRRCKNNDACLVSFGLGWKCVRGYCQERSCEENFECDDKIFCNGRETCSPDAMGAGPDGCVDNPLDLNDNIECTYDFCDEVLNVVRHDPAGCPCTGDRTCQELNNSPCLEPVCENFECAINAKPVGTPCDAGIDCTEMNTCNASGACQVGEFNNAICAERYDGFFCNGEERCEPGSEGSDPVTGCIPGVAPMPTPEDDNVDCTEVICDDENDIIYHAPTEACMCQSDEDCDMGDCTSYTCSDTFECVPDGLAEVGTRCSNGFACSRDEQCNDTGECVGFNSDLYCELNTECSTSVTCNPDDGDANSETGCVCLTR